MTEPCPENSKNSAAPVCPLCPSGEMRMTGLGTQALVRSDCQPFQGNKQLWECQRCGLVQAQVDMPEDYYSAYDLDESQMGSEQCLFSPLFATPVPRSRQLIHWLKQTLSLPPLGKSLDLGCNHGFFSQELRQALPDWQVFGYEPWPRPSALREKAIPPAHFFSGPLEAVSGQYDLLSLIHVLEHLPNPLVYLQTLPRLLSPGGHLLIQVPDYTQNAFDLCIYDHLWHFNLQTLMALLMRSGWEVLLIGRFLPKELTALCRHSTPAAWNISPHRGDALERALSELSALPLRLRRWEAHKIQQPSGPRVILGTAIAAGFVSDQLTSPPDYYFDESPQTQGRVFWGRPVIGLETLQALPAGSLFLPFPQSQAQSILNRLQRALPSWHFGY